MRIPYELYLALRYLRFHRGSAFLSIITLISMAGVTVGAAALVIALALATGFQKDLWDRLLRGTAHLTVMSGAGATFELGPELLQQVADSPGVARAGPVLYTPAMLTNEALGSPAYAQIHGVEPQVHGDVLLLGSRPDSAFAALSAPTESGRQGIVLGYELADQLGVGQGDLVRAVVPRLTLSPFAAIPRNMLFEVVGFFESEIQLYSSGRAYVRLDATQQLMRADQRASWIDIRVEDERRLQDTKAALETTLGEAWNVLDMLEQNQEFVKALNTEKLILFLAIGLIVVVAALNIVSTLILMVADKIKEIGTLTALGARPPGIARVFMCQGLIIGAVGTVLGVILGAVLSLAADHYRLIPLNPEVYYLSHVPFSPQPGDMLRVALLTLAISFGAALYPAWKAARMDPVEALRYE